MITSQYREGIRDPEHPLHDTLTDAKPDRQMKCTAQSSNYCTTLSSCDPEGATETQVKTNKKNIHTLTVKQYLENTVIHPLINRRPPDVARSEEQLPRSTRRTLAQLRAQKCPLLQAYKHSIGAAEDPSCPLCGQEEHNTAHLFGCRQLETELQPIDLWQRPELAAELVEDWRTRISGEVQA